MNCWFSFTYQFVLSLFSLLLFESCFRTLALVMKLYWGGDIQGEDTITCSSLDDCKSSNADVGICSDGSPSGIQFSKPSDFPYAFYIIFFHIKIGKIFCVKTMIFFFLVIFTSFSHATGLKLLHMTNSSIYINKETWFKLKSWEMPCILSTSLSASMWKLSRTQALLSTIPQSLCSFTFYHGTVQAPHMAIVDCLKIGNFPITDRKGSIGCACGLLQSVDKKRLRRKFMRKQSSEIYNQVVIRNGGGGKEMQCLIYCRLRKWIAWM